MVAGETSLSPLPSLSPATTRHEYRSQLTIAGLPLLHVVRGLDPATGRLRPAIGVIAVGQVAFGALAVGQLAVGGIAVGQASIGLLWGLGQVAAGVVAVGQLAFGAAAAVGQVAAAPVSLGLISTSGPGAALLWLLAGAALGINLVRRARRLAPLLHGTPAPTPIASLSDGGARIAGRVVSDNDRRAPLSGQPCAYWQARSLGPGVNTVEREGTHVLVEDATGTVKVVLDGDSELVMPGAAGEMASPDWSLQMECTLAKGDQVTVAGPVHLEPDAAGDAGQLRGAPLLRIFRGDPSAKVLVTTQDPAQMRAQHRVVAALSVTFAAAGAGLLALAAFVF